MRKMTVPILILLVFGTVYGGKLRDYRFSSDVAPTASPPYLSGIIYNTLLFKDFSAENAIIDKVPMYEVQKDFNTELQKQLIMYGVTIYNFYINSGASESIESTVQSGTLDVEAVDDSLTTDYEINGISLVSNVLTGEIEYFEYDDSFEDSYIVLTLRLYNRDTGAINWLSTLSGKAGEVIDYISDTLTHEPIDNSLPQLIAEQEEVVQEEIINRLPEISFRINPAEAVISGDKVPTVKFNTSIESTYLITAWDITVYNESNEIVRVFEGDEEVPINTEWDLTDETGNLVEADKVYTVIMTVEDELGNIVSQPMDLSVTEEIEE